MFHFYLQDVEMVWDPEALVVALLLGSDSHTTCNSYVSRRDTKNEAGKTHTPISFLPDELVLEGRAGRQVYGNRPYRVRRRRQRQLQTLSIFVYPFRNISYRCGGVPGTQLRDTPDEEDVLRTRVSG